MNFLYSLNHFYVSPFLFFFFFNDTATTEIYTLSLHDALPISHQCGPPLFASSRTCAHADGRSEEHTSELQSRRDLVCRLLLEKKNKPKFIAPRRCAGKDAWTNRSKRRRH